VSGILSHSKEAPVRVSNTPGHLVSDARTRQYAGQSIVRRLLLQHRDIVPRGMAELSHKPCFEKPQATFPGL
jgi:hypothetical protein